MALLHTINAVLAFSKGRPGRESTLCNLGQDASSDRSKPNCSPSPELGSAQLARSSLNLHQNRTQSFDSKHENEMLTLTLV
ncbi:hypothetical protein TWF569_008324 [Orbilia oligospora]|nr:hypothetical protein TWF569_008324 [Orbilia oligospora]